MASHPTAKAAIIAGTGKEPGGLTELGEEVALGHPGEVVLVQEPALVAPLAQASQPVLAHHRLLPVVVPERTQPPWGPERPAGSPRNPQPGPSHPWSQTQIPLLIPSPGPCQWLELGARGTRGDLLWSEEMAVPTATPLPGLSSLPGVVPVKPQRAPRLLGHPRGTLQPPLLQAHSGAPIREQRHGPGPAPCPPQHHPHHTVRAH